MTQKKIDWYNFNKIAKDIDMRKLWNKYFPDDDTNIRKLLKDPLTIFYFLKDDTEYKKWKMTNDEKNAVAIHFAEPDTLKSIRRKLNKIAKEAQEYRPTVKSACTAYMNDVFCDERGYNDIVWKTKYGNNTLWNPEKTNMNGDIQRSMKEMIKNAIVEALPDINDRLDAFQSGMHITVNDEGNLSSDTSDVVSSSFWTMYYNDFSVEIAVFSRSDKFNKKYEKVLVGSDYYSGGW